MLGSKDNIDSSLRTLNRHSKLLHHALNAVVLKGKVKQKGKIHEYCFSDSRWSLKNLVKMQVILQCMCSRVYDSAFIDI